MKFLSAQTFLFLLFSSVANAEIIVRMELQQGLAANNIDIKLFNSIAPLTVTSFLKYADAAPVINTPATSTESYIDSFIHVINPGFTVEGGKFTYASASGAFECTNCINVFNETSFIFPAGLQRVTLDQVIGPEFAKSNTRGTIGMKKVSASATSPSHWYFNLTDNSASLDVFTGDAVPFTVFGEVINNTLGVIDGISEDVDTTLVDRTDIHFDFTAIPLVNYTLNDPITEAELVRINSIEKLLSITSDVSASVVADIAFDTALVNTDNVAVITIKNIGANDLHIMTIASVDTLSPPFSILPTNNTCVGAAIVPTSGCNFSIQFNSAVEGSFDDSFNIEFEFGDGVGLEKQALSYTQTLSASAATEIQPIIQISQNSVDFGAVLSGSEKRSIINIVNNGNAGLDLSSIELSGVNAAEFELNDNCTSVSPIKADVNCDIDIIFSPQSVGTKNATLSFNSNDPSQPSVIIPLMGSGDKDSDGITSTIEEVAPNNGDNNVDGKMDSLQNEVASFPGKNGEYLSLVIEEGFSFSNVKLITDEQLMDFPKGIDFKMGVFLYDVGVDLPGQVIEIGIVLPSGAAPDAYYFFGATDDNSSSHWYKYSEVSVVENAKFVTPSGAELFRSLILLRVQDGGSGDADGIVNGKIIIGPGAPAFSAKSSSSNSSKLDLFLLMFLLVSLKLFRFRMKDC